MSASVSKIPVAKHRRLSPDRPSPVMSPASSPQKSVSKLPVKVSKSEIGQFKENICSDFRPTLENNAVKWMSDTPVTSPSRIPVMKSFGDVTPECVTPRNHSSANHTSSHNRPQSIDLEDEYIQGKSYIVAHTPEIAMHPQVRKMSDPKIGVSSPQRKISPLAAQVTNSRIPIASDYIRSDSKPRASPPRSISSSSLKLSPVSGRLEREGSEKSLTRTRSTDYVSADSSGTSNEQIEWTPPKPRRSSAPSPPKSHIPIVGWSLQPERQEEQQHPQQYQQQQVSSKNTFIETKTMTTTSSRRTSAPPTMSATNIRAFEPADLHPSNGGRGRRQFEAFVMTGDRMINLAKTPAHSEFRSKYYRGLSTSSVPNSPIFDDDDEDNDVVDTKTTLTLTSTMSGDSNDNNQVKWRAESVQRRSLARNSRSEDQLQMEPPEYKDEDDDISNSVHTLHNGDTNETSSMSNNTFYSALTSSPQSRKKSPPKNLFKSVESTGGSLMTSQTSSQDDSPDFSTSSLISCSEHYNGESVLDNISPKSPSSPDTPEWSLIDSFHKSTQSSKKRNNSKQLSPSNEIATPLANGSLRDFTDNNGDDQLSDSISSSGNRVVISINSSRQATTRQVTSPESHNGSRHVMSPGGSSTGTITPEAKNSVNVPCHTSDDEEEEEEYRYSNDNDRFYVTPETGAASSSPHAGSESEESDMESLRSYHPPIKVVDIPSALRLAKRLYNLEGFKKSDVSRHLSRNNEFNQVVAEEYLKFFNLTGCGLDEALRQFLSRFCLAGETQERERVLLHFARRYVKCNPTVVGVQRSWFRSLDSVHTLTCAIMLLNTDLHGENLQRKMTCNEFIENLSELNDGQNFPKELLKGIYYSIKQEAIPWAPDQEVISLAAEPSTGPQKPIRLNAPSIVVGNEASDIGYDVEQSNGAPVHTSASTVTPNQPIAIGNLGGGVNPFLSAPDPETAVNYKKGYVMRKSCIDSSGKRTKLGKRSWKMYFMTLRDMVLYCFKDEKSVRAPGSFDDLSQAIRIHHGLAVRSDHRKKQFVFRLYTSDQAQYLFQTSDEKELLTWIDSINAVVASFSAPQLPAPCSSSFGRFQRPLMPSSKSSLTFNDQLQSHERQLLQIRQELDLHLQTPPTRGTKGTALQAYAEKKEFLTFEIMRYETYILTLRTKNAHDA